MDDKLLQDLTGLDIPEGVPELLAISIITSDATEEEARQMIGPDELHAEEWIQAMCRAGYFDKTRFGSRVDAREDNRNESMKLLCEEDGGILLWNMLQEELKADESDFKHRIAVLDDVVKGISFGPSTLPDLCSDKASKFIPSSKINGRFPWNDSKFASTAVLHLLTSTDARSKREAIAPISHSSGGFTIPPPAELMSIRWPFELSKAYRGAVLAAETRLTCTALHVHVMDVEIMQNPLKRGCLDRSTRPTTFAHTFIMTVSPAGVFIYQAYDGPLGYTLLQHMEKHAQVYPMSTVDGKKWIKRFEEFAAELSGIWTEKVNAAYAYCFGADLVQAGNMRIGSQLDVFFLINTFVFDAQTVQSNFLLLPQPEDGANEKIQCLDGVAALTSSEYHLKEKPDGGVDHYYVPIILRCGHCGKDSSGNTRNQQCVRCGIVQYCTNECQVKDWNSRHKEFCTVCSGP